MIEIIALTMMTYGVLAMVGCKAMAITFHPFLSMVYGADNVKVAACSMVGKSYDHAYLLVRGKPYEPRFLGMLLLSHINYDDPYQTWDTAEHFRSDCGMLPFIKG